MTSRVCLTLVFAPGVRPMLFINLEVRGRWEEFIMRNFSLHCWAYLDWFGVWIVRNLQVIVDIYVFTIKWDCCKLVNLYSVWIWIFKSLNSRFGNYLLQFGIFWWVYWESSCSRGCERLPDNCSVVHYCARKSARIFPTCWRFEGQQRPVWWPRLSWVLSVSTARPLSGLLNDELKARGVRRYSESGVIGWICVLVLVIL